jgi:hypothetical protein
MIYFDTAWSPPMAIYKSKYSDCPFTYIGYDAYDNKVFYQGNSLVYLKANAEAYLNNLSDHEYNDAEIYLIDIVAGKLINFRLKFGLIIEDNE